MRSGKRAPVQERVAATGKRGQDAAPRRRQDLAAYDRPAIHSHPAGAAAASWHPRLAHQGHKPDSRVLLKPLLRILPIGYGRLGVSGRSRPTIRSSS